MLQGEVNIYNAAPVTIKLCKIGNNKEHECCRHYKPFVAGLALAMVSRLAATIDDQT
jgi:hypothetical protein